MKFCESAEEEGRQSHVGSQSLQRLLKSKSATPLLAPKATGPPPLRDG